MTTVAPLALGGVFSFDISGRTLLLIAVVLFFSAMIQTTVGFGYALIAAPLLSLLIGPEGAVFTIIGSGFVIDALVLSRSRGRPRPCWPEAIALALWSLPGLVLGAVLVARLPSTALQVVVAGAVLVAVAQQTLSKVSVSAVPTRAERADRPLLSPLTAAVGLASGALSTATSLGAPPVVLYLTSRFTVPRVIRDTLVVLSVSRLPLSILTLVITGAWRTPQGLPVLWVAAAGGFFVGRQIFERLNGPGYRVLTFGVLVAATVGATAAAVTVTS